MTCIMDRNGTILNNSSSMMLVSRLLDGKQSYTLIEQEIIKFVNSAVNNKVNGSITFNAKKNQQVLLLKSLYLKKLQRI